MKDSKLAIVIPYFKIDFFEQTLQSLYLQTNKNFNLYIGNDNSPYDPGKLITKFKDIITNYKAFDSNLGGKHLAKQWERCIDDLTANEEWIMLLCDDDTVSPNFVQKFYENLEYAEKNKISWMKFNCKTVDENNNTLKEPPIRNKVQDSIEFYSKLIYHQELSSLSENIFKREKYVKYGFQDVELAYGGSDTIALLEFSEFGKILFENEAFMFFRNSEMNISANPNLKLRKMKGIAQSLSYLLDNYSDKFSYKVKIEMCKKLYKCFRVVYKCDLLKNLNYFLLLFKNLKLKNFFLLCVKRGNLN